MAKTNSEVLTLTGILASTDSFGRLRLCLVDYLPSRENKGIRDKSWKHLRDAIPNSKLYTVPYHFPLGGTPDDSGIRGDCWVTLPSQGRGVKARRERILALAQSLRGKEVVLTVRPRRYSFVTPKASTSDLNLAAGTSLLFESLEELPAYDQTVKDNPRHI